VFQSLYKTFIKAATAEVAKSRNWLVSVFTDNGDHYEETNSCSESFAPLVLAAFGVMLLYVFGLQYAPLAVAFVGLAAGAEVDLIAYLCSRQFGTRAYGKIYGWQYSVFVMGYGFSPFLVGLARDHFGNYNFALLGSASAVAIAGLVAPLLRSKPEFETSQLGGGTLSEA
jgi:MFS family permease